MAEEETDRGSAFSYLWYTAIWYLVQYLIITGLHFLTSRQINKKVLQKSASDTLLLALTFIALQWSCRLLSSAIYRLPYVIFHLIVDLIPTLIWLAAAELMMLSSLGLIQILYNHLSNNSGSTSSIRSHMEFSYMSSVIKSQSRLEDTVYKHVAKLAPRLVGKCEQRIKDSTALSALFTFALLLMQLSTLALVLLETTWESVKTCYHKMSSKRMKDVKGILLDQLKLVLVTITAASFLQCKALRSVAMEGRQLLTRRTNAADNASRSKSINANNGTSVGDYESSTLTEDQRKSSADSLSFSSRGKQHDD